MKSQTKIFGILAVSTLIVPTVALAQAAYDYRVIDYPGAMDTQVFGINDHGIAVGSGYFRSPNVAYPFLYDIKTDTLTDVANVAGYDLTLSIGISDSGRLAGSVILGRTKSGLVRDLQGADVVLVHPDAVFLTEARGVNNRGLVSGMRDSDERPDLPSAGFVYDPKAGTFKDFAESAYTVAHGMNSQGDVAGSARFTGGFGPTDPCPGLPVDGVPREYGWLRTADGSLTYFTVNGERTRARGINDRGQITGFVGGLILQKGFVIELEGTTCVAVTVPTEELLEVPGSLSTSPEGITNSGDVVGVVLDGVTFALRGFVARRN